MSATKTGLVRSATLAKSGEQDEEEPRMTTEDLEVVEGPPVPDQKKPG